MHGKHLFEYAVIRVVPRVEREEFLNAGIILFCRDLRFLSAKVNLDESRLLLLDSECDISGVRENLSAICRICEGTADSGPIGQLGLAERFRWLTAIRSTIVQTSRVHPGFCTDAAETLESLYLGLVV
jgi:DUF3037 family protein